MPHKDEAEGHLPQLRFRAGRGLEGGGAPALAYNLGMSIVTAPRLVRSPMHAAVRIVEDRKRLPSKLERGAGEGFEQIGSGVQYRTGCGRRPC